MTLHGHQTDVVAIGISADGKLYSSSHDGSIREWELSTSRLLSEALSIAGRDLTGDEHRLFGVPGGSAVATPHLTQASEPQLPTVNREIGHYSGQPPPSVQTKWFELIRSLPLSLPLDVMQGEEKTTLPAEMFHGGVFTDSLHRRIE